MSAAKKQKVGITDPNQKKQQKLYIGPNGLAIQSNVPAQSKTQVQSSALESVMAPVVDDLADVDSANAKLCLDGTAPISARRDYGAAGRAYEGYAMRQLATREINKIVLYPPPDTFVAIADGTEVTEKTVLDAKLAFNRGLVEARREGTPGISPHFGLDGIMVSRRAWEDDDNLRNSMELLEAKVSKVVDAGTLGPNFARMMRLLIRGVPLPMVLISPYKPTPEVYNTFEGKKDLFRHISIAENKEATRSTRAVVGDVKLKPWQDAGSKAAVAAWKKGSRIVIASAMTGDGKTILGLGALLKAVDHPVRIFCVHTIVLGRQTLQEGTRMNIDFHDLMSTGSKKVESENDETTPDEHVCRCILDGLSALTKKATKKDPVYIVMTHTSLRALSKALLGIKGPAHNNPESPSLAPASSTDRGVYSYIHNPCAMIVDEVHLLKRAADVFRAIASPVNQLSAMLLSATPPLKWTSTCDATKKSLRTKDARTSALAIRNLMDHEYGPAVAAAIRSAPWVVRRSLRNGVDDGQLVRPHIDMALGSDEASHDLINASKAELGLQARCAAGWICKNNLETVAVYVNSIDRAERFARILEKEIAAIAESTAWCRAVHSGINSGEDRYKLSDRECNDRLDKFKANTFAADGVSHKVIVSVRKLREGFNMPALKGVVVVDEVDSETESQIIGRSLRAYDGKTMAWCLIFGGDRAAETLASMLYALDPGQKLITIGQVAQNYKAEIAASRPCAARNAIKAAGVKIKDDVSKMLKAMAIAAVDNATLVATEVRAFIEQFKEATPDAEATLKYEVGEVAFSTRALDWLRGVRRAWHQPREYAGRYGTSVVDKALMQALEWFTIPVFSGDWKVPGTHMPRAAVFKPDGTRPVDGELWADTDGKEWRCCINGQECAAVSKFIAVWPHTTVTKEPMACGSCNGATGRCQTPGCDRFVGPMACEPGGHAGYCSRPCMNGGAEKVPGNATMGVVYTVDGTLPELGKVFKLNGADYAACKSDQACAATCGFINVIKDNHYNTGGKCIACRYPGGGGRQGDKNRCACGKSYQYLDRATKIYYCATCAPQPLKDAAKKRREDKKAKPERG